MTCLFQKMIVNGNVIQSMGECGGSSFLLTEMKNDIDRLQSKLKQKEDELIDMSFKYTSLYNREDLRCTVKKLVLIYNEIYLFINNV